jgi:hypothetical protein
MAELVAPTVADAGLIARVINERAHRLGRPSEESAAGVSRWFGLPEVALYERIGKHVVRRAGSWERVA